jgi:hypothetical protein
MRTRRVLQLDGALAESTPSSAVDRVLTRGFWRPEPLTGDAEPVDLVRVRRR